MFYTEKSVIKIFCESVYVLNYKTSKMSEFYKKIMQREAFKNLAVMLAVYGAQAIIFKDIFR